RRDSPRIPATRHQPASLQCEDDGSAYELAALPRSRRRGAARRLRYSGLTHLGDRPLRRDVLFRQPAHTRDRGSSGAWRATVENSAAERGTGVETYTDRARVGTGGSIHADTPHVAALVRRQRR